MVVPLPFGQQNALFTNFSVVDLCHLLAAQVGPLECVRGNHTKRVYLVSNKVCFLKVSTVLLVH